MTPNYGKLKTGLKSLLPASVLVQFALTFRFIRRARLIQAPDFVWALVLSRFSSGTPGFAAARQCYKQLTGCAPEPRPFQLRVRSASAVRVLGAAFARIAQQWRAPRPAAHKLRRHFADIILVDSSVMRLQDVLKKHFKGLRRIPAQIKLLLAVSAFGSLPVFAKLGPGAENDSKVFPPLRLFHAKTLWLFDRGFLAFPRFREFDDAKQYFLCQSKKNTNAIITAIHDGPTWARKLLARNPGLKLRDLIPADKSKIGRTWDLDVLLTSHKAGRARPVKARLVIVPREKDGKPVGYLTNLPRALWKPRTLREMYRLRWQIELVFKEMKQHLNLESIPTADRHAAQVFVWASVLALALSRVIAAWLAPLATLVGLAASIRPALTSRALRSCVRLLVPLLSGAARAFPNGTRRLLAGAFLVALFAEAEAPSQEREDSFARLTLMLATAR